MQKFKITNEGPSALKVTVPGSPSVTIPVGGSADISASNVALVKIEDADASTQGGGGPGEPRD